VVSLIGGKEINSRPPNALSIRTNIVRMVKKCPLRLGIGSFIILLGGSYIFQDLFKEPDFR
jgi:hypothetical protein